MGSSTALGRTGPAAGRRRLLVALLAAPLAGAAATAVALPAGAAPATGPAAAAAPAVAPAAPTIRWADCVPAAPPLQCGRVNLPLDHGNPTGAKISLALARFPASNQANRIGSLFINPGGPGGSGVDFALGAGALLSRQLNGRYDIVGFDPRGIAASTPLVCFDSFDQVSAVLAPWAFPTTRSEEARQKVFDRRLAAACTRKAGAIIDHMSTADVARDLDLLRASVGDASLNYLGFSYGTQLGTVYANLFPQRVGRMVIDGVLDPIAWTTGTPATANQPFSTRLHSDKGAQATLGQFWTLCDRAARDTRPKTACSFGPRAKARFDALATRLRTAPVTLPDGFRVGYSDLIGITLGSMYSASSWPFLADFLVEVENGTPARVAVARARLAASLGVTGPAAAARFPQTLEGFVGVACSDSQNPADYGAWPRAGAAADAESGYFGRIWTWATSACQPWPGQGSDRYLGPWTARTANPVLVVGNLYDPATRYQGAKIVSKLLPNSRLLTYAGWGHTAYLSAGSTCSDAAISVYLLRGTLPAEGKVCPTEFDPFTVQSGPAARAAAAAAARPVVGLPAAVRRALGG